MSLFNQLDNLKTNNKNIFDFFGSLYYVKTMKIDKHLEIKLRNCYKNLQRDYDLGFTIDQFISWAAHESNLEEVYEEYLDHDRLSSLLPTVVCLGDPYYLDSYKWTTLSKHRLHSWHRDRYKF